MKNRKRPSLTAERLREVLRYDSETGLFWWRAPGHGRRIDRPAGSIERPPADYVRLHFDGRVCDGHRLAWLYVHGRWPAHWIDHINGVKRDNRITNLRESTQSQNAANVAMRRTNRAGLKGVHRHFDGRWRAQIQVEKRRVHIGLFNSPEEAHHAYMLAAEKHFGEFARSA